MPTRPVWLRPTISDGGVRNVTVTSPDVLVATTWSLLTLWALTVPLVDRSVTSFPLGDSAATEPDTDTSLIVPRSPLTVIEPPRVSTSTVRSRGICSSHRTWQGKAGSAVHGRSSTRKVSPSTCSETNGRFNPYVTRRATVISPAVPGTICTSPSAASPDTAEPGNG